MLCAFGSSYATKCPQNFPTSAPRILYAYGVTFSICLSQYACNILSRSYNFIIFFIHRTHLGGRSYDSGSHLSTNMQPYMSDNKRVYIFTTDGDWSSYVSIIHVNNSRLHFITAFKNSSKSSSGSSSSLRAALATRLSTNPPYCSCGYSSPLPSYISSSAPLLISI